MNTYIFLNLTTVFTKLNWNNKLSTRTNILDTTHDSLPIPCFHTLTSVNIPGLFERRTEPVPRRRGDHMLFNGRLFRVVTRQMLRARLEFTRCIYFHALGRLKFGSRFVCRTRNRTWPTVRLAGVALQTWTLLNFFLKKRSFKLNAEFECKMHKQRYEHKIHLSNSKTITHLCQQWSLAIVYVYLTY